MKSLNKQLVVLIHGLGGSRFDMWPISRRLRKVGFETTIWAYRSIGTRIETHANRLGEFLMQLTSKKPDHVLHLVTHSMGGIIARKTLADFSLIELHRVVMLAPPHQGSHVARALAPIIGWLSPSLQQLSDAEDSFVKTLPNPFVRSDIELGIVDSVKDRVIPRGNTKLSGYQDLASVVGQHGILPWYPKTIELVENFLMKGQFDLQTDLEQCPSATVS